MPQGERARRRWPAVAVVVAFVLVQWLRHDDAPSAGHYAWIEHQEHNAEVPVRFSSCATIRIAVNDGFQPDGADGVVEEAVAEVRRATGLDLQVIGRTSERWALDRPIAAPDALQPVLVDWTTDTLADSLAVRQEDQANPIGVTLPGFARDPGSGFRYYASGEIALDVKDLGEMLGQPGGRVAVKRVVMHELGHLVGLAHVDDDDELMGKGRHDDSFGPGDLRGLKRAGEGPCFG